MTNDESSGGHDGTARRPERAFDLEERTGQFGEAIISFAKTLPKDVITIPLIGQLVRAGTSVGANYCEADDAVSKKEFRCKIATCKKEARETKHWLRMVATAQPEVKERARGLWKEANELHLIFAAIYRK
jgi:four helix bundle protein